MTSVIFPDDIMIHVQGVDIKGESQRDRDRDRKTDRDSNTDPNVVTAVIEAAAPAVNDVVRKRRWRSFAFLKTAFS